MKPLAGDSLTWSAGWFNDWWVAHQTFRDSGNDVVARLTGVPYWTEGGANYLHLGISGRYVGADAGTLQLRGRPESNVTDYYVDSGKLPGDHASQLGLESVWGRGPFFVTGDYARAWVDAATSDSPRFWGGYVAVSYVLTGEHRPYDRKVAYPRRLMPQRKGGAWELVGRYSHVDLADRLVDGGIFDRETVGLNWWATRRWKIGFDYGRINLDRSGVNGVTEAFHWRSQWVY
jgi:phosphate-selective porin OprO/OprP